MPPHRTPLRYPGGKQKLAKFILEVIQENDLIGCHYVEPYAGGAGVALELLLSGKVSNIHLNDASPHIYAFWWSVLNRTHDFCSLIARSSISVEEWLQHREIVRNPSKHGLFELGFSTFFLNRCNRSGVLSGGVIGGLSQSGPWKIDARFPRSELITRIEAVSSRKDRISLSNKDAETYLLEDVPMLPLDTLVYCDPPYFERSDRLYLNHYQPNDHQRISLVIQEALSRKWLVSYDHHEEIVKYYSDRKRFVYDLQYNARRVYKGQELFIFSDDLSIPSTSSLSFIDAALSKLVW